MTNSPKMTMIDAEQRAYDELYAYTIAHHDPTFIHQHVVDAIGAQSADESDKPIKLTFSLVGLFLLIEKQFSGKAVQMAHMKLARRKQPWPTFRFPET